METEGRGRDEELGVVRENGDVGTGGRGRDEELGVVRERERRHGNRWTR